MKRRSFLTLASGLLVPEPERVRSYSFVGGWALPACFVEFDDGEIVPIQRDGSVVDIGGGLRALGPSRPYYGVPVADPNRAVRRVRTLEHEAWYRGGWLVASNAHPLREPMVELIRSEPILVEKFGFFIARRTL